MEAVCHIRTLEGLTLVGDKGKTVLEASLLAGVNFEYSCKSGQCGVCKTTLLEGSVKELKPQVALTDDDVDKNMVLTCCCAPQGDILIDAEDLTMLKGIEVKMLPVRISKIKKRTSQIIEVELRLPPTAELKFLEGQYIDVIGPEAIKRSYSIANSGDEKRLTLFIKKVDEGKLSQYWFEQAKENDLLRIEGPKGSFFFREKKKNIILLATGTGIAPIKAMLDRLARLVDVSDMAVSLYWGNRQPCDFFSEPNYPTLDLRYQPLLSKANEAWCGRTGYVQDAVLMDDYDLGDAHVYACGSLLMIEAAKKLFLEHGLDDKHFYADAFVSS